MKTQAIVPMAGLGLRFKADVPKPLIPLNGKPIFIHALQALALNEAIDSILVVGHPDFMERYRGILEEYKLGKVKHLVAGGATRRESVFNGIRLLDQDTEMVLVHDGARPLVSQKVINEAITLCALNAAVIVATEVKPTIKKVDKDTMQVLKTLDRSQLWEVQTPQVFQKDLLVKAHAQNKEMVSTDDAFLIEQIGHPVKVVKGDCRNIKITTQEDLIVAEAFLSSF